MGVRVDALTASETPDLSWHEVTSGMRGKTSIALVDSELAGLLPTTIVYRYCTIAEACTIIRDRSWSFLHPSTWPDPYEKHVGDELFGEGAPFDGIGVFAKCVSLDFRSNALWSMYGSRGGLVRIGMRLHELALALANAAVSDPERPGRVLEAKAYLARCRYMRPADLARCVGEFRLAKPKRSSQNAMRAIVMKRDGFLYENEVRLTVVTKERAVDSSVRQLLLRSVPIRDVLIDPYVAKHEGMSLVNLFRLIAPGVDVRHSTFNDGPI